MQTTLLGLAIAVILALVAALVGPYFIDWSQFRPQFEAEASRMIGAPVRVTGQLDARLLPSPSLRLRSVEIGRQGTPTRLGADKLDVEFSLTSLMRGEWRASELTLNDAVVDLALDSHGHLVSPLSSGSFDLSSLTIDRLAMTGRLALHDAVSGAEVWLDGIDFAGDVRAAAGAIRGTGSFDRDGIRYPFRLSTSRSGDAAGLRVRFGIDPADRPISLDLDGVLTSDSQVPHFDGSLTVARALALRGANARSGLQNPWKATARIKVDPTSAKLEQLETTYGTEDVGLKLTGAADLRFGAKPLLQATLSARQLDADRLLAKEASAAEPTHLMPRLRGLLADVPPPALATRVAVEAENLIFGGRPVQGLSAEIRGDHDGWTLENFAARAPGVTQLALSGRLATAPKARFDGQLQVESADPDTLSAWLRGRGDVPVRIRQPLRLSGRLSIAADRMALDDARAEIDGEGLSGHLAVIDLPPPTAGKARGDVGDVAYRLEASLVGGQVDLDRLATFGRGLAGPSSDWPEEAVVGLDLRRAVINGQELSPVSGNFGYTPKSLTLTGLRIGGIGEVGVEGEGRFDRDASTGHLDLAAYAPSASQLAAFVVPVLPAGLAARLGSLAGLKGAAQARLSLEIAKAGKPDRAAATATVELAAAGLNATVRGTASPPVTALREGDRTALQSGDLTVAVKLDGAGRQVAPLFGLDRVVGLGEAPVTAELNASGDWQTPRRFKAKLSGAEIDAELDGQIAAAADWFSPRKASLTLAARRLDLAPLFDLPAGGLATLAVSSRIGLDGDRIAFDDIDGSVAGSRLRGHLALKRGNELSFSGEAGLDTVEVGPSLALLLGASGRGADQPLGRSPLAGARGSIKFQAVRAILPGGAEVRPLAGTLGAAANSVSLSGVTGRIGGGEFAVDLSAVPGSDGTALDARVQCTGLDLSAVAYRGLALPAGKASLKMTLASRGRTSGVLTAALSGSGTLSLEGAQLPGLDPGAFDAAIAASDARGAMGEDALRSLVASALTKSPLVVAPVQIPFTMRDGSLRIAATAFQGDNARAVVSGGYDLAADQADIRANLASTTIGSDSNRPEIQIFAHGPPDHLSRTVDVSLLSSWLAVRAIDRETRRLDAIERGEPVPPSTAALPLPAAPAGAPSGASPAPGREPRRSAPRPKPSQQSEPPPPASQSSSPGPTPAPGPRPSLTGADAAPPLPPPIEVRPAPRPRPAPSSSAPRPPLVLTPSLPN